MRHSGKQQPPHWFTGKRGKNWTNSLRIAADRHGAVIIVEETKTPVTFSPSKSTAFRSRMWVDDEGNRYESRDCIPVPIF